MQQDSDPKTHCHQKTSSRGEKGKVLDRPSQLLDLNAIDYAFALPKNWLDALCHGFNPYPVVITIIFFLFLFLQGVEGVPSSAAPCDALQSGDAGRGSPLLDYSTLLTILLPSLRFSRSPSFNALQSLCSTSLLSTVLIMSFCFA